ncbi:recombination protein NinG, partial [Staphylococcus aureus]
FATLIIVFFQAEDGIRDRSVSRGLGDVYKRQAFANQWWCSPECGTKIALERRSKEREKAEKAAEKKRRREEQK